MMERSHISAGMVSGKRCAGRLETHVVDRVKEKGTCDDRQHSRITGQLYDSRTFGDQLGILGLLSVFGRLREGVRGIELVSAQHGNPDLMARPLSLCLIGSEKVNPFSGGMPAPNHAIMECRLSLGSLKSSASQDKTVIADQQSSLLLRV